MGETIISVGRTGLFLRIGAAPAGLMILAIRYTQGSAALHPGLTYFAPSELILIADDLGNNPYGAPGGRLTFQVDMTSWKLILRDVSNLKQYGAPGFQTGEFH